MPSTTATKDNEKAIILKGKEASDDKEVNTSKILRGPAKSKVQAYEVHPLACAWEGKEWMCAHFVCMSVVHT